MTGVLAVVDQGRLARPERVLVGLLVADALLAWVAVVGVYTFVERLWHELGGRPLGAGPLATHLAQLEAARTLHGLVWLATACAFLAWAAQAGWIAAGTDEGPRSPWWGAGASRGCQTLARLARADAAGGGPSAALVGAWGATFVVSVLADPGFLRLAGSVRSPLASGGAPVVLIVGHLAEIAAALLAIRVVRAIGRRGGDP